MLASQGCTDEHGRLLWLCQRRLLTREALLSGSHWILLQPKGSRKIWDGLKIVETCRNHCRNHEPNRKAHVATLMQSEYASTSGTPNCDGLLTSEDRPKYAVLRVFHFDPHPCDLMLMLLLQPQTSLKTFTFINISYNNDMHLWNATCLSQW